jgi:hypothetical protein
MLLVVLTLTACDHYVAAAAGASGSPQLTPIPGDRGVGIGCGQIQTADPVVVVDTLRSDDGACVPPSSVLVARCDPAFDPIALLDLAGVPRTFLGGRFAVPVSRIPDAATPLGVSGAGRLWSVTGDPRSLFVEGGGSVERWLAVPNARALDAPPSVHMIGDSILDGDATSMTEALGTWSVTIDAVVGRGSYDAATAAEAMPDPLPDVVVVEIGVNDHDAGYFEQNLQRVLARASHADLVLWVTAHGPDPAIDAIDRVIVAGMGAIPNGAVADWNAFVPPDQLSSDGVHPAPGSEGLLAALVTPMLTAWREAVAGRGPASCAAAVTAAAVG